MAGLELRTTGRAAKGLLILSVVVCALLFAINSTFAQSGPIIEPAPAQGGAAQQQPRTQTPVPAGTPLIEEIIVEGARRIEPDTVLSYLSVREGDPFNGVEINNSFKTLFGTGLFADVTMRRAGNALVVAVVENPIINRIAFEGNRRITDESLSAEVQLRPRVVYTRTRVQDDVRRLLEVYRRSGRFAAVIEPKVIQLEQNRVDLVFEVSEGDITEIENISFIGNRSFSDSALRGALATKETRWYRFLTSNDTYDPDRLTFDRELLRRFYLANGYIDFRVVSSVAELGEDRRSFFVTFTLEEGERYSFGDFSVSSDIEEVDPEPLEALIELETGEFYNAEAVEETVLTLVEAVGDLGYAFVDVRPVVDRDKENRVVNIRFEIGEAPKVFVERIDIRGNVRTLDRVIRREFELVEGDAFNASKLKRSRDRIRALGYFETVEVTNVEGATSDKTTIEVDVTEKSTGELVVGAGLSSDVGALAEFSIRERNLLGKGHDLQASVQVSQEQLSFDVGFTEPYFLDRNLSATVEAFHVDEDQSESSFEESRSGGALRFGYAINDRWSQSVFYRLSLDEINNVASTASTLIQAEAGDTTRSIIGQTLGYDARNSRVDPTEGYNASLTTDFAGVGGDATFLRTRLRGAYYVPITDEIRTVFSGEIGHIVGISDDVRIADRFFLGGSNLRGFESSGVGPRDLSTLDAIGGQQMYRGTIETLFPLGLPDEFGVSGAVFTDFGSLTEIDKTNSTVTDTGSIRASLGFGIAWVSPFGPIRTDFAVPLVKEDHDEEEVFRFNFGTRF